MRSHSSQPEALATAQMFHEVGQHPECVLEVKVLKTTRTGSHKFKVRWPDARVTASSSCDLRCILLSLHSVPLAFVVF